MTVLVLIFLALITHHIVIIFHQTTAAASAVATALRCAVLKKVSWKEEDSIYLEDLFPSIEVVIGSSHCCIPITCQ